MLNYSLSWNFEGEKFQLNVPQYAPVQNVRILPFSGKKENGDMMRKVN